MVDVLLVHGVNGHPNENWFPWLKSELEKNKLEVVIPQFPTPQHQTFSEWKKVFDKQNIGEDSVVIGHSLGVAFLLTILEHVKVKSAFFVAGVSGPIQHPVDQSITTFTHKKFDWESIRKNCSHFTVFHSDNDPYIPLEQVQHMAACLGISPIVVSGAGHFNTDAGYTAFPALLEKILDH